MDKFSYLIRHDISEELIGAMNLLKCSLRIIVEQYNSFCKKQYEKKNFNPDKIVLFPEINMDCFVNTDNKLIIKVDVAYTEETLNYTNNLINQINYYRQRVSELEAKLKSREKEYKKEKEEWDKDAYNRAKEWNMIRSLAHNEKALEKLDEKALAEQIYKDLRIEYGLDNLEINKENE